MRSIVIFRFFSHLPLLFVYQCITFLPLIFRFSLYILVADIQNFLNAQFQKQGQLEPSKEEDTSKKK